MNIIFHRLHAKNFLSFKDVDFDFSQFGRKTILISGINYDIPNPDDQSNGSGKTTMFQSLIFAIYGETLGDGKAAHIRNWNCGAKDTVEVALEVETNGQKYVIKRSLNGKKASSELHVFKDEEEITRSTIAETQTMIETDIVPCGKEGFLRCVILTADLNYNFFKLNKAAKNEFFESLFELTAFTDAYNKLHRQTLDEGNSLIAESRTIDQLKENLIKLKLDRDESKKNESEIIDAENAVMSAKKNLEDFLKNNDLANKISAFREDAINKVKSLEVEHNKKISDYDIKNGIKIENEKIVFSDELKNKVRDAMKIFDEEHGINSVDDGGNIIFDENTENKKIIDESNSLTTRIENGEKVCKTLSDEDEYNRRLYNDTELKIKSIQSAIDNKRHIIDSHSNITDILCKDCVVKYKKSVSIDGLDGEIKTLSGQIESLKVEKDDYFSKSSKNVDKIAKYRSAIEDIKLKRDELRAKASSFLANQKLLQKERDLRLSAVKNEQKTEKNRIVYERDNLISSIDIEMRNLKNDLKHQFENLKNEYSSKESKLKSDVSNAEYRLKIVSESKTKSFDAPIKSLEESLVSSRKRYAEIDKSVTHKKALEDILKPENIRKKVVADMLKELNFRICGYLTKMGSNYSCRFNEDFEPTFTSSKGVETEYSFFSAGERMRLSIACCFAFKDFMQVRLNIRSNILAIDEYIDSNLDANAVNGIMELIRYMVATENMTAFIISHRTEIKNGMFDGEIVVSKKNDESTLTITEKV